MLKREEVVRGERGGEFSLLDHIIQSYNEEGSTLEEIATDVGVAISTLMGWIRTCGYAVDKRIVPVEPMAVAGGEGTS